jgi:hypothetical protein
MRPSLKAKACVWSAGRSGARWNSTKRSTFQLQQRTRALPANALQRTPTSGPVQISYRALCSLVLALFSQLSRSDGDNVRAEPLYRSIYDLEMGAALRSGIE